MEKYQFEPYPEKVRQISGLEEFPATGAFIYIFHADKVPPHIGLSVDGLFYSLKAKGADIGLKTDKINEIIHRKKIPALIIKLNLQLPAPSEVEKIFLAYGTFLQNGKTCLNPIDELIFGNVSHRKIGDLLKSLNVKDCIESIYIVNTGTAYKGIPDYSADEIEKRIFELQC
ncbi:MAG: hypothetical protein R3277_12075 [Brumimicrobium sp.]|nr:hypothetical protein [Brumimicrobium sp.]